MEILIVEDDRSLAELIREKVEEAGYRAACVHSARDAVEWLDVNTPYFAILDYSLPDMNAGEMLAMLEARQATIPPFIVSTGSGSEQIAVEMMKLGAMDYMVKGSIFLDMLPGVIKKTARGIENDKELAQARKDLKESRKRYKSLVANIPGIIYQCRPDKNRTVMYVNLYIDRLTGYPASDFFGDSARTYESVIHAEDREYVARCINESAAARRHWEMDYRLCHKDGSLRWVHERGRAVEGQKGEIAFFDGFVIDITERKQAEEHIRHISFHDNLTGLYNRHYMEEEMRRIDTERQLPISVIMADVNGLKLINDNYGHGAGDELIRKTAGVLKKAGRKEDVVARPGGDEFIMLLPQTSKETADSVCERIRTACRKEFVEGVEVSTALGAAEKNSPEKKLSDVFKEAEIEMYRDKARSKNSRGNSTDE